MKSVHTVLAAALACLLLPACTGSSPEEEAGKIITQKGGSKSEITALSKKGLPHLKKVLESKSSVARMAAISALGELKGDAEATKLLIEITKKQDYNEPYYAVIALGHQGAPEAKDVIVGAYKSPNARLRAAACAATAELGDKSLYPYLNRALYDKDTQVRETARMVKMRFKIRD